jgi:hypothetical protein
MYRAPSAALYRRTVRTLDEMLARSMRSTSRPVAAVAREFFDPARRRCSASGLGRCGDATLRPHSAAVASTVSSHAIGVPKEIKTNENRIALVPAGAEALVAAGTGVHRAGAGIGSGFEDERLRGRRRDDRADAATPWGKADMIMKVKEPIASSGRGCARADDLHLLPLRRRREADARAHGPAARRASRTRPWSSRRASCRCSRRCRKWRGAWRCSRARSTSRSCTAAVACCSAAFRAWRRPRW